LLGSDYFYFQTIKKYIAIFGSVFNNMVINRTDSNGNITQIINVPISYAAKDKMLVRDESDPDINRQTAIILPRMSFQWITASYSGDRKKQSVNRLVYKNPNDPTTVNFQYAEVQWDFMFKLWIYVKNPEDGTKILEQILPFFTPAFTVKANLFPQQPSYNIPIVLGNISINDENSTNFKERRVLVYELNFALQGLLFGPVKTPKVIEFVDTNIYLGNPATSNTTIDRNEFGVSNNYYTISEAANNVLSLSITDYPGLYSNGQPSSDPNNTVNTNLIFLDQDWGIIEIRTVENGNAL
jgi:hypothetical protein